MIRSKRTKNLQVRQLVTHCLQHEQEHVNLLQAQKANKSLTYKELFIARVKHYKRLDHSNSQARLLAKVDVRVLRTLAIGSQKILAEREENGMKILVCKPHGRKTQYLCKVTAVSSKPTNGRVDLLAMAPKKAKKVEQIQLYSPLEKRIVGSKSLVIR